MFDSKSFIVVFVLFVVLSVCNCGGPDVHIHFVKDPDTGRIYIGGDFLNDGTEGSRRPITPLIPGNPYADAGVDAVTHD